MIEPGRIGGLLSRLAAVALTPKRPRRSDAVGIL